MKRLFFLILIFVTVASAQKPQIRITEISSQTVGQISEWFEFSISGDRVMEITNWEISNGGTPKNFWEKRDMLRPESLIDRETFSGSGYSGTGFSGSGFSGSGKSIFEFADALIFLPPENGRAWFFWEKSPVSLKNSGGEISISTEDNEVLDRATFPKLKAGTYQGAKYAEIWNRSDDGEEFPLIFRNNNDPNFRHSRGKENFSAPTHPDDVEILINEVSPNRDLPNEKTDFIELFVARTNGQKANLKYCEIKHNGTPLFFFETDFWVESGDFIVINFDGLPPMISKNSNPFTISTNKKTSVSSGSGTVEIILFSGTSFEITEDFLCWKKGNLSSSEQSRVDKNQGENWHGECADISDLIKNESIARAENPIDSNSKSDFHRYYNGSAGESNEIKNSAPIAKITVQGAKRIYKTTLNFTGEDSSDPDGFSDLKSFEWTKNGEVFSTEINPKSIAFNTVGIYEIALTVTDQSGAQHTVMEKIEVVANEAGEQVIDVFNLGIGSSSSFNKKRIKSWLKKKLTEKTASQNIANPKRNTTKKLTISNNFFENFLMATPADFLEKITTMTQSQNLVSTFSSHIILVPNVKIESVEVLIKRKIRRKRIRSLNEIFD